MKKYKTGLTIMRAQPFHAGHESIINQMIAECEKVVVLIGSAHAPTSDRNPFCARTRREMIVNVFGARITIGAIRDLGNIDLWVGYVLSHVWQNHGVAVDAYYSGAEADAQRFASAGITAVDISRCITPISATEIRADVDKNINFVAPANREMVRRVLTKQK